MEQKKLPQMVVNQQQPRELREEALQILAAANQPPTLFHLIADLNSKGSGTLVQIVDGRLCPVTEIGMRKLLQDIADWVKQGRDEIVPGDVPALLPKAILHQPNGHFPLLAGLTNRPFFAFESGTPLLVQTPGYHKTSRMYYQPAPDLASVKIHSHPSQSEIAAAIHLIDDVLGDFPFDGVTDRANCLAMLVTPFVRSLIDGPVPLFAIEAPRPATGKTLLAKVIALIITGDTPVTRTIPTGEDEIRKMVTAELRTGREVIILDNADRKLNSAKLAEILTSPLTTDRLLGKSEMLTQRNLALWILTANNPQFSGELNRRRACIRLDTGLENPGQRQFKHSNLLGFVKENRAQLVDALLTLVQGWVAAEAPQIKTPTLASFEDWAAVVGGILQQAGVDGFLANLDEQLAQTDHAEDEWRLFFTDWFAINQDQPFLPGDTVKFCLQTDPHLLSEVRGGGTERSQAICLGKIMPQKVGCSYGGLKLVRCDVARPNGKGNRTGYCVIKVAGPD